MGVGGEALRVVVDAIREFRLSIARIHARTGGPRSDIRLAAATLGRSSWGKLDLPQL